MFAYLINFSRYFQYISFFSVFIFQGIFYCFFKFFFRLAGSYSLLVEHFLKKCSEVEKRLCWQVTEINWKGKVVWETFICLLYNTIYIPCTRFQWELILIEWSNFMQCSSYSVIVRVSVVLKRTVVGDWRFDNLCGSHLQSQVYVVSLNLEKSSLPQRASEKS